MENGILFDLDGTLWDATAAMTPAWNRVLGKAGRQVTQADLASVMGLTDREIGAAFFPALDDASRTALVREASQEQLGDLRRTGGMLYPGVAETLRTLSRDYALFVVSNCMEGYVPAFLHAHGFRELFRDYACLGRPAQDKAANIAAICQRYGLRRAVYVGDTAGDGYAARAVGLPFFFASYGFGRTDDYDVLLWEFGELPAQLRAFAQREI